MILSARLVLQHFAVNLVDQQVDRGVEVVFGGFAVNIFTTDMERQFRSVLQWFE